MLTVYHGSVCPVENPLAGVCRPNLDFGVGFYVTDIRAQAERWALRVADIRDHSAAWLSVYQLDRMRWMADTGYRCLHFEAYDAAWLDFVTACRSGHTLWQEYDLIEGGIADDRVVRVIDLYLRGDYTREEALMRLIHQEPNNQICIVNQEIINRHLHFVEKVRLVTGVSESPAPYANPALQAKYLSIVERLISVLNLSQEQALDVFYGSDTYTYLSQRRGDLHLMSSAYLTDEIVIELQRKQGS